MSSLSLQVFGVHRLNRWILQNVFLELPSGTVMAVIGPNGSGKSTLLRSMAGLWQASSGAVLMDGRDIQDFRRKDVARQIAYVPQEAEMDFGFSVREIVMMGRYSHSGRFAPETAADTEAVQSAMARADIEHLADRSVVHLSGGERQRVLIARSLATRARILLLDEPTANLDIDHHLDVLELCRSLANEGYAIAVATHDLNSVCRFADQVTLLEAGSVVATGDPGAVLTPENLERVFRVQSETLLGSDGTPMLLFRRIR